MDLDLLNWQMADAAERVAHGRRLCDLHAAKIWRGEDTGKVRLWRRDHAAATAMALHRLERHLRRQADMHRPSA